MTKRQSFSFKEGNYKIIYLVLLKKGNVLALKAIFKIILLFKEADMNVKSLEETLVDMYMVMIRRSIKINHSNFPS